MSRIAVHQGFGGFGPRVTLARGADLGDLPTSVNEAVAHG